MSIFAPNLYVCAYHLQGETPDGATHPLWEACDRILAHLTPTRLIPNLQITQERILLSSEKTEISFTLTDHPKIEGFIQPVQLQDSYGVFLNIGYDDSDPIKTVDLSTLQRFNPNQIIPLPNSPSFIGQTLLLTLGLTPENQAVQGAELTQLANQCYQQLLQQNSSPSRLGELFGSPIFEYGNPHHPDDAPHVLIWLFRDHAAYQIGDRNLQDCFTLTFDLLFYRHKVTKAFADSRDIYLQLKHYYRNLDPTLDNIQKEMDKIDPNDQDYAHLQPFKIQLKNLSSDALIYDRLLRKMKDLLTTIEINGSNYNDQVAQIAATLGIEQADLCFWQPFGTQTTPQFRRQITADLSYFEQGTDLISQTIATIRAIVEIDQAERDRQQLELEKQQQIHQAERDRERQHKEKALQDNIQAIGVGVATGAIVASSSGLLLEPMYIVGTKYGLNRRRKKERGES